MMRTACLVDESKNSALKDILSKLLPIPVKEHKINRFKKYYNESTF